MTLARQQGLHFVPTVFTALDGVSAVERVGRLWELTEWLPGRPDFHRQPTNARLEAAGAALAQLHAVWRTVPSETTGCPAVQRRSTFLAEWYELLRSGWHPLALAEATMRPLVERAWRRLPSALECVPRHLHRWHNVALPLQPCLCDIWHDHLLFNDEPLSGGSLRSPLSCTQGREVGGEGQDTCGELNPSPHPLSPEYRREGLSGQILTGLIDYGALKVDSVAVDLARMLGSLVKDDADGWQTALRAYRRFAPLTAEEEELAHVLDETGVVLGVANWLRWLYEERRPFADRTAVVHRFGQLLDRLEAMFA